MELQALKEKYRKENSRSELVTSMASSPYEFHAQLSSNRVYSHLSTIIFDNAVVNEGNYYNPSIGQYICPVTGTYYFSVCFNSFTRRSYGRLMVGGTERVLGPLTSDMGDGHQSGTYTQSAVIRCNQNQNVYVQAIDLNPNAYPAASLHAHDSTFSGYLIRQG